MADYGYAEVGNTLLPLPNPGTNSILQDADPPLFFLIDYWRSIIDHYIGPRLATEAAAAGVTGITSTLNPASCLPYDPAPYLQTDQLQPPILAVWREKGETEMLTAGYEHDKTTFGAAFILPPLNAGQAERLMPFLQAIYKTIRHASTQGWDPSYIPPGGTSPTPGPWMAPYANLEEIWVGRGGYSYGRWQAPGGNLWFSGLMWKTLVKERDNFPPESFTDYPNMQGGDITTSLVSEDGSSITPMTQVSTYPAPTIASLSVSTGPYTGGTTLIIYGTGFVQPQLQTSTAPTVKFGNVAGTNVTFLSANALQVTTPAMQGPGSFFVAVTVTNPDGQTAVLPSAFQYV